MFRCFAFAFLLCCAEIVSSQSARDTQRTASSARLGGPVPVIQLLVGDYYPLSSKYNLSLPIKCDGERNVYLNTASGSPIGSMIQKIKPDGTLAASLSYTPEKQNSVAYFTDYSVDSGGTVSAILRFGPMLPVEIVQFDSDGGVRRHITLHPDNRLIPRQVVGLSGNGFFVAGILQGDKVSGTHDRAYAAIYDDEGQLRGEVRLRDDISPSDEPSAKRAIEFSFAVAGSDSNIYLLRAANPALMYVVSPTGQVLTRYVVEAPVVGTTPIALLEGKGRFAIMFHKEEGEDISDTRIRIIDRENGAPVVDYKIDERLTEGLACYTGDEFVFYSTTIFKLPVLVEAATK